MSAFSRAALGALVFTLSIVLAAQGEVFATWNGGKIDATDYKLLSAEALIENGRSPEQMTGDDAQMARYIIVRTDAEAQIVHAAALKAGTTLKPEEMEADYQEFVKLSGGTAAAEKRLAEAGITKSELMTQRRVYALGKRWLENSITEPAVTPAEVKDTYERMKKARPAEFDMPDRRRLAHIVIAVKPGMSQTEIAALKAKADMVRKLVAAPGADFGALARQYSADSSRERGGNLPPLTDLQLKKQLPKPFGDAALALKPGGLSPVVRTPEAGFHIIKYVSKQPAHVVTLEEATPRLTDLMKVRKAQLAAQEKVEALLKAANLQLKIAPPPEKKPAAPPASTPAPEPASTPAAN